MNILLSVLTTLGILLGAYNSLSFDQLKYLDANYWLKSTKLGAFTEISATNQLSAFPTTYNANLAKTIEVGTTSIPTITTLAGLTTASALNTIGTITAGAWQANTLQSLYGGTGTTSMSQYRVVLGNGTASTTVATSTGSAGQYLISNGEGKNPSWQTKSADTAADYTWTGLHSWSQPMNASSTLSVNSKLNVSTSTPSQEVNLAVNGGALISATTTVGGLVATTSINATQFSATATSTFNGGIKLGSGCFDSGNGCVKTKYGTFATSTGVISTNQTNTITVGFTPKFFQGMVWTDATSDVDVFGSFSQNGTSAMSIGGFDSLAVDYFTSSYIFQRNTTNDDLLVTINNITSTGFDLVYSGITGTFTSIQMNILIIGE